MTPVLLIEQDPMKRTLFPAAMTDVPNRLTHILVATSGIELISGV